MNLYEPLVCKRAIYGKVPYPMEKREYTIVGSGSTAVGCIDELIEFCKKNGYDKIALQDLDGNYMVDVETGEIK